MKEIRFRRPEFQGKLKRARKFERRNEKEEPSRLRQIWPWAGVAFLIAAAYFLFFSRVFVIESSNNEQANKAIARLARQHRYLIPKSHLVILTRRSLLLEIQKDNSEARRITGFKKIFPNGLEVAIEMREQRYIWQSAASFYSVDQDGTLYEVLAGPPPSPPHEEGSQRGGLVITDRSAQPVAVGTKISDPRLVPFLDKLQELWPKQIHDVEIISFSIPAVGNSDIFVKTKTGFQIYFDLGRKVEAQLASLNLVLSREIDPATFTGLSYVDLRLPRQAYYCYLDAKCAPENSTSTIKTLK